MSSKAKENGCMCEAQIVFFFEKPTIVVCEECERTLYYDCEVCPICSEPVTYFVREEDE